MKRMTLAILATLLTMASTTFAATQTSPYPAGGLTTTLQVSATVQTAVRLTLATNTGCAVSAGGSQDYSMNFGTVDALAINSPCANTGGAGKYAPTSPGTSNDTVYYSNYTITPAFTSFTNTTGTVTVSTTGFAANVPLTVVHSGTSSTLPANAAAFTTMTATAANVISSAASGAAQTRWIGVEVAATNGASVAGVGTQQNAVVTYTLTIP